MTIDEAINGLKSIFSNYELDLPCTDSLNILGETICLLEELKDYRDKNKLVVRIDCENIDKVKEEMKELQELKDNKIPELIKQIEFEEKWLHDAYVDNGYRHNPSDVNIAFKSIRRMTNKMLGGE